MALKLENKKLVFVGGKGGVGKCCKGNTLILTDRGLIKIEDIVNKKIDFSNRYIGHGQTNLYDDLYDNRDQDINEPLDDDNNNIKNINNIISISPKLCYEKYKIIDKYDMGENDVITIKTKIGLEISGTPEHRIIIIDNNGKLRFKKLQDMSTSDHVAISYNTNIFNERLKLNFFRRKNNYDGNSHTLKNIDYMNQDIARILGYIISEANAEFKVSGDVVTFTITTYDKEMQDDIINICNSLGINAYYHYDKQKNNENRVGIRISSVAFGNFIYYLGYRHLAQNKEVPWTILQADKDSQISFIRALFDGDGTVGLGDGDDNPYVEYNSSSYELCRQLQIVLLNFGIIGRLCSKKGAKLKYRGEIREYEENYRLYIQGGEILKFAEIINFGLSRKKEILNRYIEILENRKRWTDINIFGQTNLTNITFPNIGKIIDRFIFDDVVNIENEKTIVYDVAIDDVHSYIGNSMINHNTTVSSTVALHLSERMRQARKSEKILLFSTDPAHSISDSFNIKIGDTPTPITNTLDAIEINADRLMEELKSEYKDAIQTLLNRGTRLNREEAKQAAEVYIPGIDEFTALMKLSSLIDSNKYRTIVVDTAPTGHTIRLLSMPRVINNMIIFLSRLHNRYKKITGADDIVDDFIESMTQRVYKIYTIITDKEKTEFIVVTIPDLMAIEETKRLSISLYSAGVKVNNMVINNIQSNLDCAFCRSRRNYQNKYINMINTMYPEINKIYIPLFPEDINGMAYLRSFEDILFK